MFTNRLGIIMRNVQEIMEGKSKGNMQSIQLGPYNVEKEVASKLEEIRLTGGRMR